MGVRPAGRERQRKREREKEKGIETSGVRKGRPVKKLHSVFAQVGWFLCLEGISAAFLLSWCCSVAIVVCMMNLIFVIRANTLTLGDPDYRWLIDNLWDLVFFFRK